MQSPAKCRAFVLIKATRLLYFIEQVLLSAISELSDGAMGEAPADFFHGALRANVLAVNVKPNSAHPLKCMGQH